MPMDPLDTLRQLTARQASSLDPPTLDGAMVTAVRRELGRRRIRRWLSAATAALLSLGAGSVAWAFVRRQPADDVRMIQCFRSPEPDSDSIEVAMSGTPIDSCRAAWQTYGRGWGAVPSQLIACKAASGIPAVYPGDAGTCASLGLPELDPNIPADVALVATLQQSLADWASTVGCSSLDTFAAEAEATLEHLGLSQWRVSVGASTEDQPCARFDIQPQKKIVAVESLPDVFSSQPGG